MFFDIYIYIDIYTYFLGFWLRTPHGVQNQCFFCFWFLCFFVGIGSVIFGSVFWVRESSEKGRRLGGGGVANILYIYCIDIILIYYIYICIYIYTHKCAYVNMHMHKYICRNCLLVCVFCRRCWITFGMNIWTGWGPVGFQQVMNSWAARDGNITN